jgi:hypothetical protein
MKRSLLIILSVFTCQFSFAQSNSFPPNGNVGIGTTASQVALQIVRGGTNSGDDYPALNIRTNGAGNLYGPIVYLNATSGTGGRMWGMASSGALDAPFTGSAGNFAIYDANASISRLVINSSGSVGIGTLNPTTGLLVAQGVITSQTASTLLAGNNDAFNLYAGGGGYNDGAKRSILWSQAGLSLGRFGTIYNASRKQVDFVWGDQFNDGASTSEAMRLTGGGNLGIGTSNPDAKLTVNGRIHANEVVIDTSIPGPDYVFKDDYLLMTLSEVESYIKKYQHLPAIPSAKEMLEKGINVNEMQMKLLQKTEELTLHLIQKEKQILDQQYIIEKQDARLRKLEVLMEGQIKR